MGKMQFWSHHSIFSFADFADLTWLLALLTCQSAKLITWPNIRCPSFCMSVTKVGTNWGHWSQGFHISPVDNSGEYYKAYQKLGSCSLISGFYGSKFSFPITLKPRYNAPQYNAISDTTLIFLGSQIIFEKYIWTAPVLYIVKVTQIAHYYRI